MAACSLVTILFSTFNFLLWRDMKCLARHLAHHEQESVLVIIVQRLAGTSVLLNKSVCAAGA